MSYITPVTLRLTMCSKLGIFKGAEWKLPVRLSQRVETVDNPIDLTGFVGRAAIKKYCGQDTPVVMPTVTITNPTNGEFEVSLTAEQTSGIITYGRSYNEVSVFQYDVYMDNTETGESYRVLQGDVEVSPSCLDTTDGE